MARFTVCIVMVLIGLLLPFAAAGQDAELTEDAAAYCEAQGGTLVTRYPAMNTNSPTQIVRFANPRVFCEFRDIEEAGLASLPIETLYAEEPTIAAIAYFAAPPFQNTGPVGANPSYFYCEQLYGTIQFGDASVSGSGWVNEEDPEDYITPCVFADGSMMDSFTLFYKSDGTIRGADLTERFRWSDAEGLADMFASQQTQ